jgi:predicted phage terminase large subunit-like protein
MGNIKRDTRKTRDLILSEWYRTLWPEIALVRAGETSFANTETGTREGVAFGSLTAKRGDALVIDDPHSVQGAESEAEREEAVRLFLEGGLNRLNDQSSSALVVVMQRLHAKDLTGALLAHDLGFWHICIPMEFERERRDPASKLYVPPTPLGWIDPRTREGELMDPVRMPREAGEKLKKFAYSYAGQYQQRPAPREGGLFKRSWFKTVRAAPATVNARGRYWDLAASTEETSPYTAGVRVSELDGNFYVETVARERASAAGVRKLIKDTAEEDRRLFGEAVRIRLPQDPGQAGKDQAQGFVKMLVGYDARTKTVSGDKVTRATPASAQAEAGNVFLVETGDAVADAWIEPFLEELAGFPTFAYKDQVDAFADAINDLALAPRAATVVRKAGFGAR